MKFLSKNHFFYPSLLVLELIIFFAGKAISPFEISYSFFVSAGALILTVLTVEKMVREIYKTPHSDIRVILLMFLFLSPIFQLNLFLSYNKFLSIFFLLFAFLNYLLFEKEFKRTCLLFSFLSIIFSTYFYSYAFVAALPLLIFIIIKARWKGMIYFMILIVLLYLVFTSDYVSLTHLSSWNISNWFRSGFDLTSYNSINIIFAFFPVLHPIIFIAGILVLPFIRFSDFEEPVLKISAISFIIYSLFIAGFPFQHFSTLIITFPALIIILFPAILRVIHLTEYFRPKFIKTLPYFVFILQIALLSFFLLSDEHIYFK